MRAVCGLCRAGIVRIVSRVIAHLGRTDTGHRGRCAAVRWAGGSPAPKGPRHHPVSAAPPRERKQQRYRRPIRARTDGAGPGAGESPPTERRRNATPPGCKRRRGADPPLPQMPIFPGGTEPIAFRPPSDSRSRSALWDPEAAARFTQTVIRLTGMWRRG
ncbi:hypothetical protein AGIG_G3203 [Arapaima gigas]